MKTLIVLVLFAVGGAWATSFDWGAHAGIMMPSGDAGEVYGGLNPMFGANILVHLPTVAVEGSIDYCILSSEHDEDDWSAYTIPIIAGVRSYTGSLFLGGGGGFYLSSHEFMADTGKVTSSSDDLGAYGNAGAIFRAGSTEIEGSLKLHWVSFEDIWLSLTVGLYF
jgi:hypothetical protein